MLLRRRLAPEIMNPKIQLSITPILHYSNSAVIVGIGNELRGDDAAGVKIVRLLKKRQKTKAELIDAGAVPENYLGKISKIKPGVVILIDAAEMELPPGTVKEIKSDELDSVSFSTHAGSLSLVIDFLKQETNADIRLIGIQPGKRDLGSEMSKQVKQAINLLLPELEKENLKN